MGSGYPSTTAWSPSPFRGGMGALSQPPVAAPRLRLPPRRGEGFGQRGLFASSREPSQAGPPACAGAGESGVTKRERRSPDRATSLRRFFPLIPSTGSGQALRERRRARRVGSVALSRRDVRVRLRVGIGIRVPLHHFVVPPSTSSGQASPCRGGLGAPPPLRGPPPPRGRNGCPSTTSWSPSPCRGGTTPPRPWPCRLRPPPARGLVRATGRGTARCGCAVP